MSDAGRILDVVFYRTAVGLEPVREWLKGELSVDDRKTVGADLLAVQWRWPVGMPLVRKMEVALWELRSTTSQGIARVFFTVRGARMILLHGFVKKSQRTPSRHLDVAARRLRDLGD
jgi:phage-related protein